MGQKHCELRKLLLSQMLLKCYDDPCKSTVFGNTCPPLLHLSAQFGFDARTSPMPMPQQRTMSLQAIATTVGMVATAARFTYAGIGQAFKSGT